VSELNINGKHTDARVFTDEVDETFIYSLDCPVHEVDT